jgi:hypothetical protein
VTGLALGALLIATEPLESATPMALVGLVGAIGVIASFWDGVARRIPQRRRQVPLVWLGSLPLRATAFRWGALLGTGLLTYLVLPGPVVGLLALSMLQTSPAQVAAVWIVYAVARAATIGIALLLRGRDGDAARSAPLLVGVSSRLQRPLGVLIAGTLVLPVIAAI